MNIKAHPEGNVKASCRKMLDTLPVFSLNLVFSQAGAAQKGAASIETAPLEKVWIYKTPSRSAIVFSGEVRGDLA